jgi:hypothetical protein
MACGLDRTLAGVTVEVQVEAVLLLGTRVHVPVTSSVGSEEVTVTAPSGLNEGLYSSASGCGVPPVVRPAARTWPLQALPC